jgi:hypothetical protein
MEEHEVRPSKKRKTSRNSAVVTKLVEEPRAGKEEGGEASLPVPAPRRNPPREGRKPRHIDATTTPQGLATRTKRTTGKPPLPVKGERRTRQQGSAQPSTDRSREKVKGKAAKGKKRIC